MSQIQTSKKEIISWSLYDFGNSAYAGLIPVLLFPLWYKNVLLNGNSHVDLWWGIIVGVSVLLSGILAPIIGAYADRIIGRKKCFIISSLIAIIGTASLSFVRDPVFATTLFVLANMTFNIALTLYDSLLFNVSSYKTAGFISSASWAIGYAGGIICTLLLYPIITVGTSSSSFSFTFLIVALFYLFFALPSFLYVKENDFIFSSAKKEEFKSMVRSDKISSVRSNVRSDMISSIRSDMTSSVHKVILTIKNWREHKSLFLFLLAFYFLTEGIFTLSFFITLYLSTTLHASLSQIAIVALLSQAVAIPATILFGKYCSPEKYKRIMLVTLFIWCIATISLIYATSISFVYLIAVIIGFVVGTSQSIARAWYNAIIPPNRRGEFFGFNALASKVSTTIGPIIFGALSVWANSQRIAMASILLYFIISFVLFLRMDPIREVK